MIDKSSFAAIERHCGAVFVYLDSFFTLTYLKTSAKSLCGALHVVVSPLSSDTLLHPPFSYPTSASPLAFDICNIRTGVFALLNSSPVAFTGVG